MQDTIISLAIDSSPQNPWADSYAACYINIIATGFIEAVAQQGTDLSTRNNKAQAKAQ